MSIPRIGLIVPYGHVGGAEGWALRLLDEWSHQQRAGVRAVVLGDGPVVDQLRSRVTTEVIDGVGAGPTGMARGAGRVARMTRDLDVVWANGVKAAAVAVAARPLAGPPVVWVKHDRSHDRWLSRPLGRACRRVVAVADVTAAAVRRDDVVLVPPPLPARLPRPAAEARAHWLRRAGLPETPSEGVLLAAMVGRLSRYKEVETAIRALVDADGWQLLVVGDADRSQPHEPARLRELARSCGVQERVHLIGAVPDAGADMAGLDAVLVLTGFDEEGFGGEGWSTVALEALWASTPLVGSADGAPMAAASGGVVPTGQPAAVAARLRALADPELRARAGATGRTVLDGHPDAATASSLLRSVLRDSARPRRS